MKYYEATALIDASPATVWRVLLDAPNYPNWDSGVVRVDGSIAPGAKIIGGITVGNDVAIGANCVVIDDVPDNAVVAGVPGKVVSMNGSAGYVNNIRPHS